MPMCCKPMCGCHTSMHMPLSILHSYAAVKPECLRANANVPLSYLYIYASVKPVCLYAVVIASSLVPLWWLHSYLAVNGCAAVIPACLCRCRSSPFCVARKNVSLVAALNDMENTLTFSFCIIVSSYIIINLHFSFYALYVFNKKKLGPGLSIGRLVGWLFHSTSYS